MQTDTTRMNLRIRRTLLLRIHMAADAEGVGAAEYARNALIAACARTEARKQEDPDQCTDT